MFSGIHPTPMTERASVSFDGLSISISPDRMPSASKRFHLPNSLPKCQPMFGASGGDCRIHAS